MHFPKALAVDKKTNDSCAISPMIAYEALTGTQAKHDQLNQTHNNQKIININRASIPELTTLEGIGIKRAQDILDYRLTHGGFSSVDELTKIKGIGKKTLAKFRHRLTVM